jgi:tubulin--tyrosine ligase
VPTPSAELVKTLWELDGLTALRREKGEFVENGTIDRAWLEGVFDQVGVVIAESLRAGVECGSFGLQLVPNAFEVCHLTPLFAGSMPMQIRFSVWT